MSGSMSGANTVLPGSISPVILVDSTDNKRTELPLEVRIAILLLNQHL